MTPRVLLPAALLALAVPAVAPAVTIDDFEVTAFSAVATSSGTTFLFMTPNSPGHCISTTRLVSLTYASGDTGTLSADLTLGAADDAASMTFPVGTSSILYSYPHGGPWDLTAGGTHDQIVVHTQGPGAEGATITVYLKDTLGGSFGSVVAPWNGASIYKFPFNSFPLVDCSSVKEIDVQFHSPTGGNWSLAHIETAPDIIYDLHWDAVLSVIDLCPFCPPDPAIWDWTVQANPQIALAGPTIDVTMTGEGFETAEFGVHDSGGEPGVAGRVAMMDFLWTSSGPFTAGRFTFDVKLGGATRFNPSLSGPPGIQTSADGIALTYPVVYSDDFGTVWGSTVQTIVLSEAKGQDVDFQAVTIAPMVGRAATAGFTLQFDLVGRTVDEAAPLFDVHLLGGWTTGTTPTGVEWAEAPEEAGPMRAVPTVSRTQTVLELRRAAPRAGEVDIFDVSGRRVNRLRVGAGQSSVTWDGRDAGGSPVPAGVYLARHRTDAGDAGDAAVARMVRLR